MNKKNSNENGRKLGESEKPSASLFDDALSDRVNKPKNTKFIWPILIVLGGFGMGYSIFYGASEQKEELKAELEEKAQQEEAELEKKLADMRSRMESQNGSGENMDQSGTSPETQRSEDLNPSPPQSPPPPVRTPAKPAVQKQAPSPETARTATQASSRNEAETIERDQSKPPGEVPATQTDNLDQPIKEDNSAIEDASSEPEPELEPVTPPEHELAYNLLLENSAVAGKLANREYTSLDYRGDWRVVQQNKSEVWIDLIAHWTNGGDSVHFIWAVNPETRQVRPLSQAARNLEAENRN
jgi:hypothetical protein